MRHINTSNYAPEADWLELSKEKLDIITPMDSDEKKDYIKRHPIWRTIKEDLQSMSNRKCWYCERQQVREHFHLDHFRPKNRVKCADGSEIDGYWWLAYEYSNYRFCCPYCNSPHPSDSEYKGGKNINFPLIDETRRAISPDDDIEDEIHVLLDPTKSTDPSLLIFCETGYVNPKISNHESIHYHRADQTITLLDLNHEYLVDPRQKKWFDCERLIKQGKKAFDKYLSGDVEALDEYEDIIILMKDYISVFSEYSATAVCCFKLYEKKEEWIESIFI